VVSVGLFMHFEYMRTLKMVNIGVNGDSGNTQVRLVISRNLNYCLGCYIFNCKIASIFLWYMCCYNKL
jgi:hypothetical protein